VSISVHKACVFGNPIEQSKSPTIHQMFASQVGIELVYANSLSQTNAFVSSADDFFAHTPAI